MLFRSVLFNLIWLATWVLSASGPYYYWPIWPMIGTAIPVIIAWVGGNGSGPGRRRELER